MSGPPAPEAVLPKLPERHFTFHLIPHTHWDREWYLSRAAFQARLVPVLDSVLAQLEQDPAARFVLDGQTVLLEDYLAVRPGQWGRIAEQVRLGALEIGPWYVLADLLIPSLGSLRRNLAEGTRDAERFGRRLEVLYSPDAFGHPAVLPQLAAEFGIRWAVLRRGVRKAGAPDRDLFRWDAANGAGLLVYHLPAAGYDIAGGLARAGAGAALERHWRPIRRELVERAATNQIAVFLGADHHAMPANLAGLCADLRALEPGHEVRVSGLREFFTELERALAVAPPLPVLRGELRHTGEHTWVLQGVHATRARMKRRHGAAELALARLAEPLAEQAREAHGTDRRDLLRFAWRTLLQCQFHDTLAGTTCDEAQHEQEVRLAAVEALTREIAAGSLHELAGHDADRAREQPEESRLVLWNPSGRARSGICTAELTFFREDILVGPPSGQRARIAAGTPAISLELPDGSALAVQVLAQAPGEERLDAPSHYPDQDRVDRVWVAFEAPELPPHGIATLRPRPLRRTPAARGLEAAPGRLANRFLEVTVSELGVLVLTDRRTGERYPGLGRLSDQPDLGDAYTPSPGAPLPVEGQALGQRLLAEGPLVGALETRWMLRGVGESRIPLRQVVSLNADTAILRVRLELDNTARDHRLRAHFPTGVNAAPLGGAPLGAEPRPAARLTRHPAAAGEQELPTAPAQRWVAAAEGSRGLALLFPGFFELESARGGELRVTLLRAIGLLSRGDLAERPGHAAWPVAIPEAQEPGGHRIDFALLPISAAELSPPRLEALWEDAFVPVQALFLRNAASP